MILGRLGFDGALIYNTLVMLANREGRVDPNLLFEPAECDIETPLEPLLARMEAVGLIVRYTWDGRPLIQLTPDWDYGRIKEPDYLPAPRRPARRQRTIDIAS